MAFQKTESSEPILLLKTQLNFSFQMSIKLLVEKAGMNISLVSVNTDMNAWCLHVLDE